MNKKYFSPQCKVVLFKSTSVITTSDPTDPTTTTVTDDNDVIFGE